MSNTPTQCPPIEKGPCLRCGNRVHVLGCRFCKDCWYPGIDEVYNDYRNRLAEGYQRIDAAVQSGWMGIEEINGESEQCQTENGKITNP